DCGPIPASVELINEKDFQLVGAPKAEGDKTKFDKIFECEVKIFEKTGILKQKIKVLSANPTLKIEYAGQVCTERDGKCVSFDGDFEFQLTVAPAATEKKPTVDKKAETPQ